jgi:hypothetical protein
MNAEWVARFVTDGMPESIFEDKNALQISAPRAEIACRDFIRAKVAVRKQVPVERLASGVEVEVLEVVNPSLPGGGRAGILSRHKVVYPVPE